jgi:hypothetical protein
MMTWIYQQSFGFIVLAPISHRCKTESCSSTFSRRRRTWHLIKRLEALEKDGPGPASSMRLFREPSLPRAFFYSTGWSGRTSKARAYYQHLPCLAHFDARLMAAATKMPLSRVPTNPFFLTKIFILRLQLILAAATSVSPTSAPATTTTTTTISIPLVLWTLRNMSLTVVALLQKTTAAAPAVATVAPQGDNEDSSDGILSKDGEKKQQRQCS